MILAFFLNCECGCRVRVDWLCNGGPSAPVAMEGRKKLRRPEAESGEASAGNSCALQTAAALPAASGNGGNPAASDRGAH